MKNFFQIELNEAQEIQAIDRTLRRIALDEKTENLILYRRKLVSALELKNDIDKAINQAILQKNNHRLWSYAYELAQDYDKKAFLLFKSKSQTAFFVRFLTYAIRFNYIVLTIGFVLGYHNFEFLITWSLLGICLLEVILAPVIVQIYINQFTSHKTNDVIRAACNHAPTFHFLSHIDDENSLIAQLMNVRNNLEKIGQTSDLEIPDEFICPITLQIMTDPVIYHQMPQSFERTAILDWIKNNPNHPFNSSIKLDIFDLQRNFSLKRKIDEFVDKNTENLINIKGL